jgi:hypothetical protein
MISRAHQLTIGGSVGFHSRRRTKRSDHEECRPLPYIWQNLMAAAPTVSFEAGMDSRAQARQLLEIDLRATLKRADRILLPADPCSPCSARATRGAA